MILIFFIGVVILVGGYFTYGKYIENQLGVNPDRPTPAYKNQDGVDYVPIKKNKNQLIQLLNIAGTGPIYGPISAAVFGPIALLLIPIGNIFFGAVQDYIVGFMSIRNGGSSLPTIASKYVGNWSKIIFTLFTALLLILVATVFVTSPAELISNNFDINYWFILVIIFAYYIISTIMPVDKIIGRIYPYIAALLVIGTTLVLVSVLMQSATGKIIVPEFSIDMLFTWKDQTASYLIPGFFVFVSCGFISGFHTTQSPIVAKTLENEKEGRQVFYGMMVLEGLIAMIWALVTMIIFDPSTINTSSAPELIPQIATVALGSYLSWIIILAVVILPITSGDTAFRSLRSVIAELLSYSQAPMKNRIILCLPIFFVSFLLITAIPFQTLWQYFTWANHLLAVLALITATVYLKYRKKNYFITLIPAIILFIVDMIYLLTDKGIGFGMESRVDALMISIVFSFVVTGLILYFAKGYKIEKKNNSEDDFELEVE